jgi:hypothetical protein
MRSGRDSPRASGAGGSRGDRDGRRVAYHSPIVSARDSQPVGGAHYRLGGSSGLLLGSDRVWD